MARSGSSRSRKSRFLKSELPKPRFRRKLSARPSYRHTDVCFTLRHSPRATGALAHLGGPQRAARRRRHRGAVECVGRHARPRRRRGRCRATPCRRCGTGSTSCRWRRQSRDRPRRPSAARRLPAAGAAAAPHVGRRAPDVPPRRCRSATRSRARRASRTSTPRAGAAARWCSCGCATRSPMRAAWRSPKSTTSSTATAPRAGDAGAAAAGGAAPTTRSSRSIVPDPVLLFRYSALTFNGHRIHYDRSYVTEVEGYPGLVVHGPLIATLLLDLLRRERPERARRALRASAPCSRCSTSHPFDVCGRLDRRRAPRRAVGARPRRRAGDGGHAPSSPDTIRQTHRCHEHDPTSTRRSATPCARCARQFPDEYFRKVDEERGYPEAFVDALTEAGWLAALIPEEYGGSGLGLTEASVIMEEINRSGGNSGACHGQMYNMGTLLRHGSRGAEAAVPAAASRPASCACSRWRVTEPTTGTDTTKIKTTAVKKGDRYVVNGQKVWISRVQHSDLMILLARTTPLAEVQEEVRGHVDLHRRPARGDRQRADRAADPQHGQPRDQRALLRQPRDPGGEPDRRGGQGLQVHPRRAERRAHADRRRVHRRRLLVHRPASPLRERARRVRPADRPEPGRAVPDRRGLHRGRGGRT